VGSGGEQSIEIVRKSARCFETGDWEGLRALTAPNGLMTPLENWPEPGPFRGREAIVGEFQRLLESFEQTQVSIEEITEEGDWVIGRYLWVVRGTGSDVPMETRFTGVLRIEDGQAVESHFRFDHAAALAAAGISAG
jgi:ketosteroid isomerase-like protein